MERKELVEARICAGLSQEEVAEHVGVTRNTVSQWERGLSNPYPIHVQRLCKLFDKSAKDLELHTKLQNTIQRKITEVSDNDDVMNVLINLLPQETLQKRLTKDNEHQDGESKIIRRQLLLQFLEAAGITLLAPAFAIATHEKFSPSIEIEEFISQCASGLKACWHLMKGKGLIIAEEILLSYIPSLTTIIHQSSRHTEMLAELTAHAKILQAVLAMHKLNFHGREIYCYEAVKYSRLSEDIYLQAGALMYLAYTYTYCFPRRPKKATTLFLKGLHILGNEPSILKSDIYIGLADAYAQIKQEQEAFEAIGLAHAQFPDHPELDPSFLYADYGRSEIYQWEGKMYLHLAEHYPDRDYSQKAFDAFSQSIMLQSIAERSATETIIHQADAARGIGDLDRYVKLLAEGAQMARSLESQKRYSEAFDIFQRTPARWKKEQQICQLAKDVFGQSL